MPGFIAAAGAAAGAATGALACNWIEPSPPRKPFGIQRDCRDVKSSDLISPVATEVFVGIERF